MESEGKKRLIRISVWVAIASLLLAVLSSLATALAASAHAALRSMTPAAGSTVTTPPTEVVLTFNETISTSFATVTVTDDGGRPVSRGRPAVSGKTVTQPLQEVGSGRYTVAFRVVSEDGHPVSQKLSFAVALPSPTSAAPAATPTTPTTTAAPSTTSTPPTATSTPIAAAADETDNGGESGPNTLLWGLGAGALVVAGAGAAAWRLRRQRGE
jgi:methionine-rich copper-binding protein CopC